MIFHLNLKGKIDEHALGFLPKNEVDLIVALKS